MITIDTAAQVTKDGFAIIPVIYEDAEIQNIAKTIDSADSTADTFRKSAGLFAIRQILKEIPAIVPLILNQRLRNVITKTFGEGYFPVKSIYFDKPGESNWFVAWHQDLTISVDAKQDIEGYGSWTVKQGQFAVQPPLNILENIYTIRIHLDDTDSDNGALRVIQASHAKGIYRPEVIDHNTETEIICNVPKGGIMIMKPLLLHASGRTINNNRRRVIHIEFSSKELPEGFQWAERLDTITL